MQTIKASEFKAKCLHLMDVVNQTKEGIVITKNGKPVSKLVPYSKPVHSGANLVTADEKIVNWGEKNALQILHGAK